MAYSAGPKINVDKLTALFDVKNNKCYRNGEWRMISVSENRFIEGGEVNISTSGIYDGNNRNFSLDGTDDLFTVEKNKDTEWKWGKTISIRCNSEPGYCILDNNGTIQLYYTEGKRLLLGTTPDNYLYNGISAINIDSSNNIIAGSLMSNHAPDLKILNLDGKTIKTRKAEAPPINYDIKISYSYGSGKIVEYDGFQYVQTFSGYTKTKNIIDNDFEKTFSKSNANSITGDIDVDASYAYIASGDRSLPNTLGAIYKVDLNTNVVEAKTYGLNPSDGFEYISGIAIYNNYIFATDRNNSRVVILDKNNLNFISQLGFTGVSGSDASSFKNPRGVCVNSDRLYICDYGNQRIKIYDASTLDYIHSIDTVSFNPIFISANDNYVLISNLSSLSTSILRVYNLSDSSLILEKNYDRLNNNGSYGPGDHSFYGAKQINYYDGSLYIFDRNNCIIEINPSDNILHYKGKYNSVSGDGYDVVIDSSYFHMTNYTIGIKAINKNTLDTDFIEEVSGSGNLEWGGICYGIEADASYLYVSDSINNRIQILNKSDYSYYSQFGSSGSGDTGLNFNRPVGMKIFKDKFYIIDSGNSRVNVYNYPSLNFIESFSIPFSSVLAKIRCSDDEIFISGGTSLYVFDISSYSLKRSNTYLYEDSFSKLNDTIYGIELVNNNLYIADNFSVKIIDSIDLDIKTSYGPFFKTTFIETPIDNDLLIDIVFTDDYKVNLYANGYKNDKVIQYDNSTFNLNVLGDIVCGVYYNEFNQGKYDWLAFYDKAKTYEEHLNDYNQLKSRII